MDKFRGVENFSEGVEIFTREVGNISGGVEILLGVVKNFQEGLKIFREDLELRSFWVGLRFFR